MKEVDQEIYHNIWNQAGIRVRRQFMPRDWQKVWDQIYEYDQVCWQVHCQVYDQVDLQVREDLS